MSMRMDEEDWAHTLTVFRACLPRRGRKGEDDRRFLEALHFFTVENVRWRALPERFGNWNSVWKRFDRLSKAGVFEAFFDALASMSSRMITAGCLTQTAFRRGRCIATCGRALPSNCWGATRFELSRWSAGGVTAQAGSTSRRRRGMR
jgi:transposase